MAYLQILIPSLLCPIQVEELEYSKLHGRNEAGLDKTGKKVTECGEEISRITVKRQIQNCVRDRHGEADRE